MSFEADGISVSFHFDKHVERRDEMDAKQISKMIQNKNVALQQQLWRDLMDGIAFYNSEKYSSFSSGDMLSHNEEERAARFWNPLAEKIIPAIRYYTHLNGMFSEKFVHDGTFYSFIDQQLNHYEFAQQFDHKAYYPLLFNGVVQPDVIASRINGIWVNHRFSQITEADVVRSCGELEEVIIKPSRGSCGGMGVSFFRAIQREELHNYLRSTSIDIVIQKVIQQHPVLRSFHRESVNTIRFSTLLWKGKSMVLSAVLRMGAGNNRVDNASAGGSVCGIDTDGNTKRNVFQKNGDDIFVRAEQSPVAIPGFQEATELVLKLCYRVPYCRMVAWDIAIDASGTPIFIEANLKRGEIDFLQWCNGPLFGDYTEEIWRSLVKKCNL